MLRDRENIYRRIEALRGRPLIVYVTSSRNNSRGNMSADAVPELMDQLNALPPDTNMLDLMIASDGGDPTVAWRFVSLIRERVEQFAVLVPQAAYSAATLLALGADEIVMHPNGNLGPTDPQIRGPKRKDGAAEINFGSEDLSAFLRFARDEVGLSDQAQMLSVFNHFCEEVGSVAVGVSARSAQLSVSMGEKLLQLHMKGDSNIGKTRSIAQALTTNYFHHGYAVSRSEAKTIGLPIAEANSELESLMWAAWLDICIELKQREPFMPLGELRQDPAAQALFGPVQNVLMPANLPAAGQQLPVQMVQIPPVPFRLIAAVMESPRHSSFFEQSGLIFGSRLPDLTLVAKAVPDRLGWVTAVPAPAQAVQATAENAREARKSTRKSAKTASGVARKKRSSSKAKK